MYLEEQKILLAGIDHGFSTIKTAHFVFENGVKELGGESTLLTNTMVLNDRYFKVGEGRLPLKDTKVVKKLLLIQLLHFIELLNFCNIGICKLK